MAKRAAEIFEDDIAEKSKRLRPESGEKHTLDSDEEDSGDDDERYNILNENDIEGEEDGISRMDGEAKLTPFNMKEELEEGHFDREGHFQWKKVTDIKDNWLDNIDWMKVKTDKKYIEKTNRGLADSSDSDGDEPSKLFNEIDTYRQLVDLMKPGETVKKTLLRLGGNTVKLSSAERWKRKKAGIVDENAALVTKFTELANNILTQLGNMDVYQETYEEIKKKVGRAKKGPANSGSTSAAAAAQELDMYADDFETKEQSKLDLKDGVEDERMEEADVDDPQVDSQKNVLQWEYKLKDSEADIHGPYSTEQMLNWSNDGTLKDGVVARKVGEDTKFYSCSRIDFDLYL